MNVPNMIRLGQFLKWRGLVGTGGEAKMRIQAGEVRVNGEPELRRGRRLVTGDRVEFEGSVHLVPALAGADAGDDARALDEPQRSDPIVDQDQERNS